MLPYYVRDVLIQLLNSFLPMSRMQFARDLYPLSSNRRWFLRLHFTRDEFFPIRVFFSVPVFRKPPGPPSLRVVPHAISPPRLPIGDWASENPLGHHQRWWPRTQFSGAQSRLDFTLRRRAFIPSAPQGQRKKTRVKEIRDRGPLGKKILNLFAVLSDSGSPQIPRESEGTRNRKNGRPLRFLWNLRRPEIEGNGKKKSNEEGSKEKSSSGSAQIISGTPAMPRGPEDLRGTEDFISMQKYINVSLLQKYKSFTKNFLEKFPVHTIQFQSFSIPSFSEKGLENRPLGSDLRSGPLQFLRGFSEKDAQKIKPLAKVEIYRISAFNFFRPEQTVGLHGTNLKLFAFNQQNSSEFEFMYENLIENTYHKNPLGTDLRSVPLKQIPPKQPGPRYLTGVPRAICAGRVSCDSKKMGGNKVSSHLEGVGGNDRAKIIRLFSKQNGFIHQYLRASDLRSRTEKKNSKSPDHRSRPMRVIFDTVSFQKPSHFSGPAETYSLRGTKEIYRITINNQGGLHPRSLEKEHAFFAVLSDSRKERSKRGARSFFPRIGKDGRPLRFLRNLRGPRKKKKSAYGPSKIAGNLRGTKGFFLFPQEIRNLLDSPKENKADLRSEPQGSILKKRQRDMLIRIEEPNLSDCSLEKSFDRFVPISEKSVRTERKILFNSIFSTGEKFQTVPERINFFLHPVQIACNLRTTNTKLLVYPVFFGVPFSRCSLRFRKKPNVQIRGGPDQRSKKLFFPS